MPTNPAAVRARRPRARKPACEALSEEIDDRWKAELMIRLRFALERALRRLEKVKPSSPRARRCAADVRALTTLVRLAERLIPLHDRRALEREDDPDVVDARREALFAKLDARLAAMGGTPPSEEA